MAPDDFTIPETITVSGRRFRARTDGNTCYYEQDTSPNTYPGDTTDAIARTLALFRSHPDPPPFIVGSTTYDTLYRITYVDSNGSVLDAFETEDEAKERKLRWRHFIHGLDLLSRMPRVHAWRDACHRPAPRPPTFQPPRWVHPAKAKLPTAIRAVRTELKRLSRPRRPRRMMWLPENAVVMA